MDTNPRFLSDDDLTSEALRLLVAANDESRLTELLAEASRRAALRVEG